MQLRKREIGPIFAQTDVRPRMTVVARVFGTILLSKDLGAWRSTSCPFDDPAGTSHARTASRLEAVCAAYQLVGLRAERRRRPALDSYRSAVSSQIVNGPSLTSSTAISAPNRPVATVTPSPRSASTNRR